MLTPLALFLGLLVATAFIAHWSDNLGKKLGKKRVSVFGLRPRTSATVLTVVSSWAIMGFTLLALLLAVAPLKTALFSIDAVRGQLSEVTGQLKTSKEQLPVVQKQLVGTQRQLEETQGQVENAKKQTLIAQKQVEVFEKDAKKYQGEASKSRDEAKKARRDFENARRGEQSARASAQAAQEQQKQAIASLASVRTQLESSRSQVEQTQGDLENNRAQLRQAERNVKQASQNLKEKQTQLKTAQRQTNQAEQKRRRAEQATRRAEQATLRTEQAALRVGRQTIALGKQNLALEKQNGALQKEAQSLQANIREAREIAISNGRTAESYAFSAVRDISLRLDQTLSERPIDAGLSPAQIENELRILADASQNAAQEFVPGARVIASVYEPDPKTGKKVALTQKQTVEAYARALALANEPVSARLLSAFNYPDDTREVLAYFLFVPMRTIYTARQTIAQAKIDTTKNESDIFGQLDKLITQARVNAIKSGSNPPLSPEDKNFFAGDTGQKMFDTLRKIQRMGSPVLVRIVAARDLDATEPLQIRFQIGEPSAT